MCRNVSINIIRSNAVSVDVLTALKMTPLLFLGLVISVGANPFPATPRTHSTFEPYDSIQETPRVMNAFPTPLIQDDAETPLDAFPTPRIQDDEETPRIQDDAETPLNVFPTPLIQDDAETPLNVFPTPLIQDDAEYPPPPFNTLKKNPITTNPETTEKGEILWEGDMVLSEDQVDLLTSSDGSRKAINDEKRRWTNGVVPFTISESSQKDRQAILAGLKHWTDNSCLKFTEVQAGTQQPHLIFKKLGGCFSDVGMQYWNNGQDISIGQGCTSMGTVAHEVGHALGFWHEQSRPDRDQFLWLIEDNVQDGKLHNFKKHDDANTYGLPYDFTSIMHYGFYDFSKNQKPTIVPKDVMKTFSIQDDKLSFYDLKMANMMYKCDAKCSNKPACRNQGYVDHNCRCRCPDGYTGSVCERYAGISGSCGGKFTNQQTITSPGFPNKYQKGTRCIWSFEAPSDKKVRANFRDFDLIQHGDDKKSCPWDYLEVRGGGYMGTQYCEKDLKNMQITSNTNKMDLLFKADYDWNTGFKIDITFV